MSDTYDSAADAAADKAQQQSLLTALNGWDRALRRNECGAWRINGKYGSIHTWGDRDRRVVGALRRLPSGASPTSNSG